MNLRYDDMNLNRDGSVMTEEMIREERLRRGYCTECRGHGQPPVLLFTIKKARFNPLWSSKEPLTVEGECLNGKCLRCHPELDPNRRSRNRRNTVRQSTTASSASDDPHRRSPTEHLPHRSARLSESTLWASVEPFNQNGDHNVPRNPDRVITATVHRSLDGAITSMSSPSYGRFSLQDNRTGHAAFSHPESSSRRPLTSSRVNLSSAVASISIPEIFSPDEPSTSSSVHTRVTDESSATSSTARHDSDRLSRSERVDEELADCHSSSNSGMHQDEDDHMEINYDQFRRHSSVRMVRPSAVANITPPASDTSPVLSHLIRTAAAAANNDESGQRHHHHHHQQQQPPRPLNDSNRHHSGNGGSNSIGLRKLSTSSGSSQRGLIPTDTMHDRLARNLDIPPDFEDDVQFENRSTGASASSPSTLSTPTPVNEDAIVQDLGSLFWDLQVDGNYDVAIDILLEAMREYSSASRVQDFCLSTIWDLGKDNARFRTSIMATKAPDDILLCMKHNLDNASIQEQACGALWALAVDQDSRSIIVQAGAMPRVIKSIANHRSHENVIRAAMGCIRTLSPEPEARVSIGILDGIKHVCAAMRMYRSVVSIQVDGCAFLSNVAVDLDKQLVALATDEEIEVIVEALAAHRTDPTVTAGACFALKNYTYDERNLRKLMKIPNVKALLEDVARFETEIGSQPYAACLLERFNSCTGEDVALEDEIVNSLVESYKSGSEAILRVLDVMADYEWSTKVTAAVLRCLSTLVNEKSSRVTIISNETLTEIVFTIKKMMHDKSVVTNGCEFLELFAKGKPPYRTVLVRAGLCPIIMEAMMIHDDVELLRAATGVLKYLSRDVKCCHQIRKRGENPLDSVLARCSNDPTVYENVSETMENVLDVIDISNI